ncbi:hypothetical protein J595_04091 [Acinetobacter sp. 1592897]|nr:hypothetical protein J595_04091 [Acinetobacter sp. 1592897]
MSGRTPNKKELALHIHYSWQPLPKAITTPLKNLKQLDDL